MMLKQLIVICFIALLVGCAGDPTRDAFQGKAPNKIYQDGHDLMLSHDYHKAAAAFASLASQYPYDKYTEQGNLELIYANYEVDEPALAIAAATRFLRMYPQSPDAAYAFYMLGIVKFNNGRGFLQRYFPYSMAQHHADNYFQAFDHFNTVVTRYPDSSYAADAKRRMLYLRNIMAEYEINVADYYMRMKAYVAAVARSKQVLIHYPYAPVRKRALEIMVEAYKALNLRDLASDTQKILDLNYPAQAVVASAEKTAQEG